MGKAIYSCSVPSIGSKELLERKPSLLTYIAPFSKPSYHTSSLVLGQSQFQHPFPRLTRLTVEECAVVSGILVLAGGSDAVVVNLDHTHQGK